MGYFVDAQVILLVRLREMASREIFFPEIFGNPFRKDFYCSGTDNIAQECSTKMGKCLLIS